MINQNLTLKYIKNLECSLISDVTFLEAVIFSAKYQNSIFVNVIKTLRLLELIRNFLLSRYKKGERFLFVGAESLSSLLKLYLPIKECFYLDKKWVSGTLTNFVTIYKQISKSENSSLEIFIKANKNFSKKQKRVLQKKIIKSKDLFNGIKLMKKLPTVLLLLTNEKSSVIIDECFRLGIIPIGIFPVDKILLKCPYFIWGNFDSKLFTDFFIRYCLEY